MISEFNFSFGCIVQQNAHRCRHTYIWGTQNASGHASLEMFAQCAKHSSVSLAWCSQLQACLSPSCAIECGGIYLQLNVKFYTTLEKSSLRNGGGGSTTTKIIREQQACSAYPHHIYNTKLSVRSCLTLQLVSSFSVPPPPPSLRSHPPLQSAHTAVVAVPPPLAT